MKIMSKVEWTCLYVCEPPKESIAPWRVIFATIDQNNYLGSVSMHMSEDDAKEYKVGGRYRLSFERLDE